MDLNFHRLILSQIYNCNKFTTFLNYKQDISDFSSISNIFTVVSNQRPNSENVKNGDPK